MGIETVKKQSAEISYELIYTKRKSVGIYINAQGNVTVRAPYRMKKSIIQAFVLEKADWILETKAKCLENQADKEEKKTQSGSTLFYLGEPYELQIVPSDTNKSLIQLDGDKIILQASYLEPSYIKGCLEAFYRNEAKKILTTKVASLSKIMGVSYGRITIKNQKTRWGSCSGKGNLNFNWKIIMAPESIIDYLVVHELAHRKEMNHSAAFYAQVEKYFPEYKKAQNWLKENGKSLNL